MVFKTLKKNPSKSVIFINLSKRNKIRKSLFSFSPSNELQISLKIRLIHFPLNFLAWILNYKKRKKKKRIRDKIIPKILFSEKPISSLMKILIFFFSQNVMIYLHSHSILWYTKYTHMTFQWLSSGNQDRKNVNFYMI